MIAIFDRQTGTGLLPITELLQAVTRHSQVRSDEPIALTRMGGAGECVWELESKLDAVETVLTTIKDLLQILSGSGQFIDELRCINENISFGLFDATYLFVEAANKEIEKKIASEFQQVTVIPDHA